MARIFSEVFTKPSYVQEDFLDHTYGTVSLVPDATSLCLFSPQMYTAESKRKITHEPALSLSLGGSLFGTADDATDPTQWSDVSNACKLWNWA